MSAQGMRFVATVNNYSEQGYEALKRWSVSKCSYAVIGKEKGEKGTPHLQCFFIMKKRIRIGSLTNQIEKETGKHPFTAKANGTNDEAADYCKKERIFWEHGTYSKSRGQRNDIKTFFEAVKRGANNEILAAEYPKEYAKYHAAATKLRDELQHTTNKEKIKNNFNAKPLRKWQRHALNKLMEQDDRHVLWIYDSEGNLGKSWLGNWIVANMDAFLVEGGKCADIAHAYNYEPYVIFDYTRSQEERVNYSVIESFKNGRIFAPKYESKLKVFEAAKIICFSNFNPDREKLSNDRWQVLSYDGPNKPVWMQLEPQVSPKPSKPELKRTYCQALPRESTPPLSDDDDDDDWGSPPPTKKARISCQQCRDHNCNVHSENCMA